MARSKAADDGPDFGAGYLPPPPAPPAPTGPAREERKGSAPPRALATLGDPPADLIGAKAYLFKALMIMIDDALTDPDLSRQERRQEVRQLAASIDSLRAKAEMWEIRKLLEDDRAELERRTRAPTLEDVPDGG